MSSSRVMSGSSSTIKSLNLRAILMTLLYQGSASRVQLAQEIGCSTTTITNLVTELLEQGIVAENGSDAPEKPRGVGRPQTALRLVPEARYALGIHFDVDHVRVAVTDLLARPVKMISRLHMTSSSPEAALAETAAMAMDVVRLSGVNPQQIIGAGVGMSGLVDPEMGINVIAPSLGWHDVPIHALLAAHIPFPVVVDNGVRAMALGETMFGVGRSAYSLAFVYARVGVGSGYVVGGQVYRGSGAGAGEIGHTTIIPDGGETCRCGNTGCLETLISEPAIIRLSREIVQRNPRGLLAHHLNTEDGSEIDRIFAAARAGDEETRSMLEERARYMGIALANLVNVLNPELIVLGGLLAVGRDLLVPQIERVMRARSFANLGERVRLQITGFDYQAGVIGAAALALSTYFYQPPELRTPVLPQFHAARS